MDIGKKLFFLTIHIFNILQSFEWSGFLKANEKWHKYKSQHVKTISNYIIFSSLGQLCSYHPEVSHTIHYKLNSLALIYQQTLKIPLSLSSDPKGLHRREGASNYIHTYMFSKYIGRVHTESCWVFCRPGFHNHIYLQLQRHSEKPVRRCVIEV